MQQALERRYRRLANGEGQLPDILFIDGGKGQVSQARQVLATYDITSVKVVGVARAQPVRQALRRWLMLIRAPRCGCAVIILDCI